MKVITLRQPWASLVAHGIKTWETRGWKPGPGNMRKLMAEGLLIHAGKNNSSAHLMGTAPFRRHLTQLGKLPYGAIIGHALIGRIITTEDWLTEFIFPSYPKGSYPEEYFFGDYGPKRWAWELKDVRLFDDPIPYRGAQTLFN